jgi:hypothetical protein
VKRVAAKQAGSVKSAPGLTPKESDALRITRELAREAKHAPQKPPVHPDRTNRYLAPST